MICQKITPQTMVEMSATLPFVQHLNPMGKKNHFQELQKYLRYRHKHCLISLQYRRHKTFLPHFVRDGGHCYWYSKQQPERPSVTPIFTPARPAAPKLYIAHLRGVLNSYSWPCAFTQRAVLIVPCNENMIEKINKYELTGDADSSVFKWCRGIRVGCVDMDIWHISGSCGLCMSVALLYG